MKINLFVCLRVQTVNAALINIREFAAKINTQ
jgi:hypothetical protein